MTPPTSDAAPPSLWVVAACFNEAAGIRAFIRAIEAMEPVQQLLLINNGSRDNKAAVIRAEIEARRDQTRALPV
jgi:glycosyltransferase involved in cell wall biosynthesis